MNNRRLALAVIMLVAVANLLARNFDGEHLRYKVLYKWGLINKTAGYADIRVLNEGGELIHAQLTAASEPWADPFYKLRDTLNATMQRADFSPVFYEKIAHEASEYKHDTVKFKRTGQNYTGECTRYVEKKGKTIRDEKRTLTATGPTVDMLSSFYVMRNLPYEHWTAGHTYTASIFSGKQKELLTIKYRGIDTIEINNVKTPCYHITFIFTGNNRTKTSDDMDAWISTDEARRPLKLEGKLPVGKVQCFLTD